MLLRCTLPLAHFVLEIDASFEARVTSIFGPSGAGKTSLLDAIAGLRRLASGEIEIGGRLLFSSSRGIDLPPRGRSIGYVPQEAALFPHLSVRNNILFGAGREASPAKTAAAQLGAITALLEIAHLLDRPVTHLSGGEGQRVALARALLSRPRLLLLDEPLAALDVGLKERIIPYLRRVRDEFAIPIIYVTHNPIEVLSLADWVLVIREGRLVKQGPPQQALISSEVLSHFEEDPVENVFDASLLESDPGAGRSRVCLDSGRELFIPYRDGRPERFLQIRIRGDDIVIATKRPEGISAGNVFSGTITGITTTKGQAVLSVDAGNLFCVRLTTSAVERLGLSAGQEVFLIIKTNSCLVL